MVMSSSLYDNPKWLRELVATKLPRRQSLGADKGDIEKFMSKFTIRAKEFPESKPTVVPGSRVVTEVINEIYCNNTDHEEDEVEIKGQRSASSTNGRNYQLSIGRENTKKFSVGGSAGLNASFFNIGGAGISLNSSFENSTTKKEEQQYGISSAATLGKEYSITGKIKIPPHTSFVVTITTYSCTFRLSDVQVIIEAPALAQLRVRLANACCCRSKYCFIAAEDFLKTLCDPRSIVREDNKLRAITMSQLTYLGEETKVIKDTER